MSKQDSICPECDGPVIQTPGRGRPKTYCCDKHRASAYRKRKSS